MAQDKSSKTEKATPQRRRKAREEGQVAKSAELGVFASLLGGALVARVFLPEGVTTFASETTGLYANLTPDMLTTGQVGDAFTSMSLAIVAPFAAVAVATALVSGFSQVGVKIAPKAARPKLSNLSPKKGLERFKPTTAAWELVRTLLKLGLLAAVVYQPLMQLREQLSDVRALDEGIAVTASMIWTLLLRGTVIAAVIGAADYAVNKRKHEKQLKMSKDEVKREHKDSEGDPLIKAQRRQRASELSRNRMLRDVADADVVLVNPTELAVALTYTAGTSAPKVVARGADHIAAKIRAEARRNGVPVRPDKPLCRAIFRKCRVGDPVPADLFEAVAIVLAWAYRRSGRSPAKAA